jgi:hypothetical protein
MSNRPVVTLALAVIALALPGEARAAPENQIAISYSVDAGGLTMLKINYEAALSAEAYRSAASIKTKGLAGLFSAYQMDMSASGSVSADDTIPARFASRAEKSDKQKTIELRWQGDSAPEVKTTPPDPEDEALIAGGLKPGLVDPLSMILRMTAFQADEPCRKSINVVDGHDVYRLSFTLEGKTKLSSDSPGAYRGPALKCSMTYVPLAGRAARKFKKNGSVPERFALWLAPVSAGNATATWFFPVVATGKLQGMSFVAYAREVTLDGMPIAKAD